MGHQRPPSGAPDPAEELALAAAPVHHLAMTRALTLILGLVMLVQVIKPLGLPGLRRRADAWKLGVGAFLLIAAMSVMRPE